jgi:hypothetical protein
MIFAYAERNEHFGVEGYPVVVSSVGSNAKEDPLLVDAGNRSVT